MPDTKISALTDGTTAQSTDAIPVARSGANYYITPGYIGTTLLGSGTALTGATVTTSSPVLNLTQTWNDGAGGTVTFTGLKFNATDTASASGSLLLDIGTGGGSYSSKFKVDKSGNITPSGGVYFTNARINQGTNTGLYVVSGTGATQTFAVSPSDTVPSIKVQSTGAFYWATSSNLDLANNNQTTLTSPAAATLQLGAADTTGTTAPTAQFLRVQSWSSSTNNNQLGADFTIQGSRGTGTGAGGSIIFQVAPASGSSNGVQNAYSTALTITSARQLVVGGTGSAVPSIVATAGATGGYGLNGLEPSIVRNNSIHTIFDSAGIDVQLSNGRIQIPASGYFNISDVTLRRDTTSTLALRNGTSAQTFNVYGSYTSATNYQRVVVKTLREVSSALSGATYVSTIAIPAYALLVGVTTRVNTAITGATSYSVGDGTTANLWGNNIGIALNSQSQTSDFTAVGAVGAAATSRTVTLTANGSNFTGGVVEICLHYLTTEAD